MTFHEIRSYSLSSLLILRWPIWTCFKALLDTLNILHDAMSRHLNCKLIFVIVLSKLDLLLLYTGLTRTSTSWKSDRWSKPVLLSIILKILMQVFRMIFRRIQYAALTSSVLTNHLLDKIWCKLCFGIATLLYLFMGLVLKLNLYRLLSLVINVLRWNHLIWRRRRR